MPRILVTSRSFGKTDPAPIRLLESKRCELVWNEKGRALLAEELLELLPGCVGVIAGLDHFTGEVFREAKDLKIVARYGVGVDRVDLDAAAAAGVIVTNTPTANSDSVADLAIALMLSVARAIPDAHRETLAGNWPKPFGCSLFEKRVGLVGLGRIGARVARRAKGFDCEVFVYDPFVDEETAARCGTRKVDSLDELLAHGDFVSLHVPVTPSTKKMINRDTLARMKSTAVLVNTSRGELIDESDLLDALKNRTIYGAALDAFEDEPPQVEKYRDVPNLVLTPHMGAYTAEALFNMAMDSATDLLAVLEGKPPTHRVV